MLVALLGLLGGAGLSIAVYGLFPSPAKVRRPISSNSIDASTRRALLAALGASVVTLVVSRTVAAPLIAGSVVWVILSSVAQSNARSQIEVLRALATWTESLRDSVASQRGLIGAIESTSEIAPPLLRSRVGELVSQLRSGVSPGTALSSFAAGMDGAGADEAVAPLIAAARFGGGEMARVLAQAARSTRDQISMMERVELARERPRRELRIVLVVTAGFILAAMLFGHSYFKPFTSASGQLFMLLAAGLFVSGFVLMNRMSRPQPLPRLFVTKGQDR